jgi:hypothetical protein
LAKKAVAAQPRRLGFRWALREGEGVFKSNELAGILAALSGPRGALEEAALDEEKLVGLCGLVDDDGPDVDREDAVLALAGLLTTQVPLRDRIAEMVEDACAFAAYGSGRGVTVYECHRTRNLLLAFVALLDLEAAARVAARRQIHWPDARLWPDGAPRSFAAVFTSLATAADEKQVGALGQRWLKAGILPESLTEKLRPLFEVLVEFRKERSTEPTEESSSGSEIAASPDEVRPAQGDHLL